MNKKRESGFLLVGMLLNMAVGTMLVLAVFGCLAAILKMHEMIMGSFLLQEETRFAVSSLVRDLTYAHAVKCSAGRIVIYTRNTGDWETMIVYETNRNRLMKNSQPLTGDEKVCRIKIQDFSVALVNSRVATVRIRMFDTVTCQTFSLESAAVLLNAPKGGG